jgi:hypothetical protein
MNFREQQAALSVSFAQISTIFILLFKEQKELFQIIHTQLQVL